MTNNDKAITDAIEAHTFRALLAHLDANKHVQNIDLMILANFCRNCIAKWYKVASEEHGIIIDYEQARERVYGMPYAEYKKLYQTPATLEQQKAFEQRQQKTS